MPTGFTALGNDRAVLIHGSVNGFADFHNSDKWMAMAVEAFGFPKQSTK